jgi:hypothetical protein
MYLCLFCIGVHISMGKPSVCSVSFVLDMQYAEQSLQLTKFILNNVYT